MNVRIVLLLIAACLAVVFIIQNVAAVTVSVFFWDLSLSLALLVFFLLIIGFGIGWFGHSYFSYQKVKNEVADIQADLHSGK